MALLFFEPEEGSKQFLPVKYLVEKKDGLLKVTAKQLKFYIQFVGLFHGTDIVILWGPTNGQQSISV